MEKLELKHLAPYLSYKLKVIHEDTVKNVIGLELNKLYLWDQNLKDTYAFKKQVKPILRPLSDLTKEIEINGRKITPIKQLSREGVFFDDTPISNIYDDYRDWSVWEYETLISWHFDIFGLIEKGLAINVQKMHNKNK